MAACAAFAAPASAAPPIGDGDGGFALTEIGRLRAADPCRQRSGHGGRAIRARVGGAHQGRERGQHAARQPFLDISDIVQCCGEEGLLSIAFHPDYKKNRLFYVYFNDDAGRPGVDGVPAQQEARSSWRCARAAGRALHPTPRQQQPQRRRDRFGPDGLPLHRARATAAPAATRPTTLRIPSSLLGKLLRIDPRKSCTASPRAREGQEEAGEKARQACAASVRAAASSAPQARAYSCPGPTRSSASRAATRSTRSACATRSASPSTRSQARSRSATWDRAAARR